MEGLGGREATLILCYVLSSGRHIEWWSILSRPFLWYFEQWITVKLHYKAQQRQLSQGCTIFIDSYYVICNNYVWLCKKFASYAIGFDYWSVVQDHTIAQYQKPCLMFCFSCLMIRLVLYYDCKNQGLEYQLAVDKKLADRCNAVTCGFYRSLNEMAKCNT